MTILFWNFKPKEDASKHSEDNNEGLKYLKDLTSNHDIDILVLIESKLNPSNVLLILNEQDTSYYYCPNKININTSIQIFTKFSSDLLVPIKDFPKRYTARKLTIPSKNEELLFIVVHFYSKVWHSSKDQTIEAANLSSFINESESEVKHQQTIVLGDFNMNPFEDGMVQTTGLHATMDKQTALKVSKTVDGNDYKYFYNPMWSFFGEEGKSEVNGTYYHRKGHICYYWNILDQVIFRPEVIEYFDENSLQIITNTPNYNLLKSNGRVNEKISDHLPVMFKLNF